MPFMSAVFILGLAHNSIACVGSLFEMNCHL